MNKNRKPKATGLKMTPDQLAAHLGRRSSGAAGTHGDRRTKRNRSRSAQRARAIREGM